MADSEVFVDLGAHHMENTYVIEPVNQRLDKNHFANQNTIVVRDCMTVGSVLH
jgi:hypothetical protein